MPRKKGTSTVPANETKEQALLRLANKRVPKALKAIQMIGNLAGYKPLPSQVKHIIDTLNGAVKRLEGKLSGGGSSAPEFNLTEGTNAKG